MIPSIHSHTAAPTPARRSFGRLALAALGAVTAAAGLAFGPASASAATVAASDGPVTTKGRIAIHAALREANDITIVASGNTYIIRDAGAPLTAASRSCQQVETDLVRCVLRDAGPDSRRIEVRTLDGDDTVRNVTATPATMYGGNGKDTLIGGGGADELHGERDFDYLYGRGGNDLLRGGHATDSLRGEQGNDRVLGEDGDDLLYADPGADIISGGAGADKVIYAGYTAPVTVDLDGARDDGAKGEQDMVLADVEHITGGNGNDTLAGNGLANIISGGPGDDRISGLGGNDTLYGDAGRDVLIGGPGADGLFGLAGADILRLADGEQDRASSCGPDSDRVSADRVDLIRVTDCEQVSFPVKR